LRFRRQEDKPNMTTKHQGEKRKTIKMKQDNIDLVTCEKFRKGFVVEHELAIYIPISPWP